jgi:uncharacterized membrane protein
MLTFFKYLMALLYIAAGINHFVNPGFYEEIMPPWVPLHYEMVLLSGIAEILLGILLLIPRFQRIAAWGIIAMLLVFMTVHLHMLVHADDQYADVPVAMLWLRLPLQGLLIFWAWWYTRPAPGK